ncbi:hypothetical protein [Accumulibacter sp.]|uniref:hypothetical protein n=1 Tax=Accumulibacter sp. TaxID=2053492 RepID=UPI002590F17D|nr:hypothetical protein [Accumulibacter sp.]
MIRTRSISETRSVRKRRALQLLVGHVETGNVGLQQFAAGGGTGGRGHRQESGGGREFNLQVRFHQEIHKLRHALVLGRLLSGTHPQ